jgi:hypothetical protein
MATSALSYLSFRAANFFPTEKWVLKQVGCPKNKERQITRFLGSTFITVLLLGGDVLAEEQPIQVGLDKQLLVDDFVVDTNINLTRRLGQVVKADDGRPLTFTHRANGRRAPIETWPLFVSIHYDSARQKFRMWHRVSFDDPSRREGEEITDHQIGVGVGYHRAYSESDDGLNFELVALLEGLTSGGDTNLVVTIDEHEDDPEHRYKICYDADTTVHGAAVAHSADGIHFKPYNNEQPVTYRAADYTNQIYWDPKVQSYRLLTRTDFGAGGGPLADRVQVDINGHGLEVRGARSMLNRDFKRDPTNWTLERHWLFDGQQQLTRDRPSIEKLLTDPDYLQRAREEALRRQVYYMTHWVYEGVYFGLLNVLEYPTDVSEGTETDHLTRHERSVENYYIATSRDAISWDFHWVYAGQPLVPRGPDGAWDKDMVFATTHIITHQDKHWIYYGGTNERHGAAERNVWFERDGNIGLAWLRLDGFVALEAGDQPGSVTTRPFALEGSHLELNVAAGDGEFRVELLDEAGEPIDGLSGKNSPWYRGVDQLRFQPHWANQTDLSNLMGKKVRLKIYLKNARLYAFQFRP